MVEKIGAAAIAVTSNYVYDELNRLTAVNDAANVVQSAWGYDIRNNRTSQTQAGVTLYYQFDSLNQLNDIRTGSASGPVQTSLLYDASGNLYQRTDGAVTTQLSYDNLNRLASVSKTGLPDESYGYDDSGRRVRKSVGGANRYYVYNGDDILAEYSTGWTAASAAYTQGPATDDPFLRMAGSSRQFYHQDGLGSVIATSDATTATVAGTQRFDAWGNVAASTGTTPSQYGYTGREPDATGLMYYRARYYSADTGRFTQRDPIGLAGGINDYGYVGGNPVNAVDPDGLQTRAPPPRSNPNVVSNLQALELITQIQRTTPQFRYPSVVSAPGEGGYSSRDVMILRNVLQGGGPIYSMPYSSPPPSSLPRDGRHSGPVFMGYPQIQQLTPLVRYDHQELHRDLNSYLRLQTNEYGQHMRPQSNNSGRDIQRHFSPGQRDFAMREFYNLYEAKYPSVARDFFTQFPIENSCRR